MLRYVQYERVYNRYALTILSVTSYPPKLIACTHQVVFLLPHVVSEKQRQYSHCRQVLYKISNFYF